jgi:glucan biosynthesis protein C
MWFLSLLLVADFAAAGLHQFLPRCSGVLTRISFSADTRPVRYFGGLVIASALAYVPLAVAFTPMAWLAFGPFALHLSRPLRYAVYFFAGVGIGACGIEPSLFEPDGMLVRRWAAWLVAALKWL